MTASTTTPDRGQDPGRGSPRRREFRAKEAQAHSAPAEVTAAIAAAEAALQDGPMVRMPVDDPPDPPAPATVDADDDVFVWQSRRGPIAVLKVDRLRGIRPNLFARLAVMPGNPSIRFVRHLLEVCVDAAHPGDPESARAVMDRLDYLDPAESTAFDEAWRAASNGLDPGN